MDNLFRKVNEKKIKQMLYEMEVHKARNSNPGVSFVMYQYLINGLVRESDQLVAHLETVETELNELKEKMSETIKDYPVKSALRE